MNLFQCKQLNKCLLNSFKDMIQRVDTKVNDYVKNERKRMAGTICAVHSRLFGYVIKRYFSVRLCAFYPKLPPVLHVSGRSIACKLQGLIRMIRFFRLFFKFCRGGGGGG